MADQGAQLFTMTACSSMAWLLYGVLSFVSPSQPPALESATDLAVDSLHVATGANPCTFQANDGLHHCSADVWHFVGRYADRADGQPTQCLWIHPPKNGAALTIRAEQVQLAGEVTASLALMPGSNGGATVTAQFLVDEHTIGTLATDHERKVVQGSFRVPPGPPKRNLVVRVQSKNNRWRLACLRVHGVTRSSKSAAGVRP